MQTKTCFWGFSILYYEHILGWTDFPTFPCSAWTPFSIFFVSSCSFSSSSWALRCPWDIKKTFYRPEENNLYNPKWKSSNTWYHLVPFFFWRKLIDKTDNALHLIISTNRLLHDLGSLAFFGRSSGFQHLILVQQNSYRLHAYCNAMLQTKHLPPSTSILQRDMGLLIRTWERGNNPMKPSQQTKKNKTSTS